MAQQVLQLKQGVAQNEQIIAQMSAGAAQTEMAFAQMSAVLEESREDIQKHFDNVRSEVSVRLGEVHNKMNNIKVEISGGSPTPACPAGW